MNGGKRNLVKWRKIKGAGERKGKMEKLKNRDEVVDVVVRNFLEKKKTEMKFFFSRENQRKRKVKVKNLIEERSGHLGFCWLKLGEFGSARLNSVLLLVTPPPLFWVHFYWIPILILQIIFYIVY